jgi:hypothetical protein
MRRLLIILAAAAALMLAGPPAGAIINGTPDDNGHPNVGVMLLSQGDGFTPATYCSGALLSNGDATHDAVFLTAGHCVAYLEYQLPAGTQVVVSFDSNLKPGPDGLFHPTNVIAVHDWSLIPSYFSHGANHRDVGVLFLSASPGLSPVTLPAPGFDEGLVGQQLTEVGYGLNSLDRGFYSQNANFTTPGKRLTGTEKVSAVTPEWLITHADPNSTCFGDSGGPQFSGGYVVSLTRTGDYACRGVSSEQRLDLSDVRAWLDDQTG